MNFEQDSTLRPSSSQKVQNLTITKELTFEYIHMLIWNEKDGHQGRVFSEVHFVRPLVSSRCRYIPLRLLTLTLLSDCQTKRVILDEKLKSVCCIELI